MSHFRFKLLATIAALSLQSRGSCPRHCSGHGTCDLQDLCTCFDGYTGPDCSMRTCDKATAFVGKLDSTAYFGIDAHRHAECGRAGICNRQTGQCECFDGHAGAGCGRIECPNECGLHGSCTSIRSLGETYGADGDPGVRGDGIGPKYGGTVSSSRVWDEYVSHACVCNWGRTGPGCSIAVCPRGDNPLTTEQQQRVVRLTIDTTGATSVPADGTQLAQLRIAGHTANPIDVGALHAGTALTASACKAAIEASSLVASAECTPVLAGGAGSNTFDIKLTLESARSVENNLFRPTGDLPVTLFSCDMSMVGDTAVACGWTDIDVQSVSYTSNGYSAAAIKIQVTDASSSPNKFSYTINGVSYGPLDMVATSSGNTATMTSAGGAEISFASVTRHTLGAAWFIATDGEVTQPGYREFDMCGGIGLCDVTTGLCFCHPGSEGVACHLTVGSS